MLNSVKISAVVDYVFSLNFNNSIGDNVFIHWDTAKVVKVTDTEVQCYDKSQPHGAVVTANIERTPLYEIFQTIQDFAVPVGSYHKRGDYKINHDEKGFFLTDTTCCDEVVDLDFCPADTSHLPSTTHTDTYVQCCERIRQLAMINTIMSNGHDKQFSDERIENWTY